MLFKIGRKLSKSGAISSFYEIYNPPLIIKIIFLIIGFDLSKKKGDDNLSAGIKLRDALQGMGTTFIKLGQFLATRPDIIGKNVSTELEKLQDKLPAFSQSEAKNILSLELGEKNFSHILNLSEPIAAASIAQVHFAKIKYTNKNEEIAIKILLPDFESFL